MQVSHSHELMNNSDEERRGYLMFYSNMVSMYFCVLLCGRMSQGKTAQGKARMIVINYVNRQLRDQTTATMYYRFHPNHQQGKPVQAARHMSWSQRLLPFPLAKAFCSHGIHKEKAKTWTIGRRLTYVVGRRKIQKLF